MSKKTSRASPSLETIENVPLLEALEERFLAYALSTITHRALPDVRDGLKPVHRRLLYAMSLLNLAPGAAFKKCARVVGDVIGKFHPHGDQAVYDAMVRLVQGFAQRYPLIDGQGNFGTIDGDHAAAYRYTEARLTEIAQKLLDGLDEDAVNFRETYNGEDQEPVVLPAAFPNLLVNGALGIAVGMATSVPPHNLEEVCAAARYLIHHPEATAETLLAFIPGPDFPTGGILVEPQETILRAYETGRGSFRLRARWHIEKLERENWQIIITEIPYQVQKSRLIEKIAELITLKKLSLLVDVRDLSAEDMRIVLEPKAKTVDPAILMEHLFKMTDLEVKIPLNMNVLRLGKIPEVLSLKRVLQEWLDHRLEVLLRCTRFRLDKVKQRLEILEGYRIAYLNIDEIIEIIRNEDDPKSIFMARFSLTSTQSEAILNMRLRSLKKLEEISIQTEYDQLFKQSQEMNTLLKDPQAQWQTIDQQIAEIQKRFGADQQIGKRRTTFETLPTLSEEALVLGVEKEPLTLICSEKGWVRTLKGHGHTLSALDYKEGDHPKFSLEIFTTDQILIASSCGRFFTLQAHALPSGRGQGEPLRLMIDLKPDNTILGFFVYDMLSCVLFVTEEGYGLRVALSECLAQTKKGKQVILPKAGSKVVKCLPITPNDDSVAIVGQNHKLLVFPLDQIPLLSRGKGVKLQKYQSCTLSDVRLFSKKVGLQGSAAGSSPLVGKGLMAWCGDRGQAGRLVPQNFLKNLCFF